MMTNKGRCNFKEINDIYIIISLFKNIINNDKMYICCTGKLCHMLKSNLIPYFYTQTF